MNAFVPLLESRHATAETFQRNVHCLLGLPFDAVDMAGALRVLRDAAAQRRPTFLSTPNINFVIGCRADRAFRDSVLHSDLSVADGMPVVWVARLLGIPIRERVAGSGLFEALHGRVGDPGAAPLKVYFFGGSAGVAAEAARRLNEKPAGLVCVGYDFPGHGTLEEMSRADQIERINASGADFLVVSLGAKRGQAWIERNRARLTVPVVSHLGAVLNFAAGTVRRAPHWMQASGLEWLWRIREENALWRRYTGDGIVFLALLATRVAPLALLLRRRPARRDIETAAITETESWRERVIRLRGAWVHENLQPLRECFSRNALGAKSLRLDLAGVSHADTSFLGLLLLLHGLRGARGLHLRCGPVSPQVEKLVKYGCGEFLLRHAEPPR